MKINEDNRRVDTLRNRELWGAVKKFIHSKGKPDVKFQTRHDRETVGRADDGDKIHLAPASDVNVLRVIDGDKVVVKKGSKEYTFAPSSLLIMNLDDLPLNRKPEGVAKEERFLKDAQAGELEIEGLDYIPGSVKYVGKSRKKSDFTIQEKDGTVYNVSFKYLGAGQPSIMSNLPRPSRDEPWLQTMIKHEGLNSDHVEELMKLGMMKKGFPYWHDDLGMDDAVFKALTRAFTMYLDRHGVVDPVNAVMTAKDPDLKDILFFRSFDDFWDVHGGKVHFVADTKTTFSIKLYTSDKEREKKDEADKLAKQEKKMDEASHNLLNLLAEGPIPINSSFVKEITNELLRKLYIKIKIGDAEKTLLELVGGDEERALVAIGFDEKIEGTNQKIYVKAGLFVGEASGPEKLFAKTNGAAGVEDGEYKIGINLNSSIVAGDLLVIYDIDHASLVESFEAIVAHELTHIRDNAVTAKKDWGEKQINKYERQRASTMKKFTGFNDSWAGELAYLTDMPEIKARESETVHLIRTHLPQLLGDRYTTDNHPHIWPAARKNKLIKNIVMSKKFMQRDLHTLINSQKYEKLQGLKAFRKFRRKILQTAVAAARDELKKHYDKRSAGMRELADAVVMDEVINDYWYDMGADKPDDFEKFRAEARKRLWSK